MKKTTYRTAVLMSGIAFILMSCLEELENTDKIKEPSFQPAIEFPLVSSDFSMKEFLTEGESKARISERNGLMVLTYDDSLTTPSAETYFTLPDQQSPTLSVTGTEASPPPGSSVMIAKNLSFPFNTSNSEVLDSIFLKGGQMTMTLTSTFPANINLHLSIPSFKVQGAGFARDFSFTGPGTQAPVIDLRGAVIDLTDNGTTANTVVFEIAVTVTHTGQAITNAHHLDFSFKLDDLAFRGIFGDLGTQTVPLSADSIDVDIFENAFSGNVELLSPGVRLTLHNSFGIPIEFDIQNLSTIRGNTTTALSGSALVAPANPYNIVAPLYAQPTQSARSVIDINGTNSNLGQLLSALPNYMSYKFGFTLNPGGAAPNNFVLDDSRLAVGVHLELPFHGRISALSLSKEFSFDGFGVEDMEQTYIKVKTVNELPLDAYIQIYFRDSNGNVLDSLFTDRQLIKGAPVGSDGFTLSNAEKNVEVALNQAKIDRVESAVQLVMNAVMYTSDSGTVPVKFTVLDKLKINIGVNTRVQY
jgi:hypothetical protein